MGGVQVHPIEVRPSVGHGHPNARSDSGTVPAAATTKDAVPSTEGGRQTPPRDLRPD